MSPVLKGHRAYTSAIPRTRTSQAARCLSVSRKGIRKEYAAKASAASCEVRALLPPPHSATRLALPPSCLAGMTGMTLTDPRLAHGVLPVLIWTAGPDGRCDYLNERWTDFTGRP